MSTNNDPVDELYGVPAPKKNNWKMYYGFVGFLAVTGLILVMLYAERPKRYEVMPKRKAPPVRSVYALVMSPLDTLTARATVDSVRAAVNGPDSSDINMIVASTKIYKRFVSSAEFLRVLKDALLNAQQIPLDKQSVLLSQLCGILIKDTLPTKMILIGRLASTDFEPVRRQLNTSSRIIVQRNTIFGPVQIESFLEAPASTAVQQFLGYFSKQGIKVSERKAIPLLPSGPTL
jgi:hypothetical protein